MTRALDPVMRELRDTLLFMSSRAEAILAKSVRALVERDASVAAEVDEDDLEIDKLDVQIDGAVLRALALQAPVAEDLREVIAIKMIASDLERVGDLARNIAKNALVLAKPPRRVEVPEAMQRLAQDARDMLHRAMDAFADYDVEIAQKVLEADDTVDAVHDDVMQLELREISEHPERAAAAVELIRAAGALERVGDHATNIAEDVILVAEARNVKHAQKLGKSGL
jgi:phosphate transport system protein